MEKDCVKCMNKVNLKNLEIHEIEELLASINEPKYRAKQIFEWLHKGVVSFEEMTNISKETRLKLDNIAYIGNSKIIKKFESKIDETVKYLIELQDGNIIESVLMKYIHGYSICISSQVGCKMGCNFCASTLNGFVRNLSSGEMADQVIAISKDIGQRISNIVIMGIGEPLDNYDNLIKFLYIVNNKHGLNIGLRHITVSTCGLVPKIIELSKLELPITLAISLHAPNNEIRRKIMPIANKYTISDILEVCREYIRATNRRITFEYSLIKGVNDSIENAKELANILQNLLCHVNLIPVNQIKEREYKKGSQNTIKKFQQVLLSLGIEATVRRELGRDINASCGQLRNMHQENINK